MLYLRHPYLTVEQSLCQDNLSRKDIVQEMIIKQYKARNEKFEKHVTLPERLIHLKVSEAWE